MDPTDLTIVWKVLAMTATEFDVFLGKLSPNGQTYLDTILEKYEASVADFEGLRKRTEDNGMRRGQ